MPRAQSPTFRPQKLGEPAVNSRGEDYVSCLIWRKGSTCSKSAKTVAKKTVAKKTAAKKTARKPAKTKNTSPRAASPKAARAGKTLGELFTFTTPGSFYSKQLAKLVFPIAATPDRSVTITDDGSRSLGMVVDRWSMTTTIHTHANAQWPYDLADFLDIPNKRPSKTSPKKKTPPKPSTSEDEEDDDEDTPTLGELFTVESPSRGVDEVHFSHKFEPNKDIHIRSDTSRTNGMFVTYYGHSQHIQLYMNRDWKQELSDFIESVEMMME